MLPNIFLPIYVVLIGVPLNNSFYPYKYAIQYCSTYLDSINKKEENNAL